MMFSAQVTTEDKFGRVENAAAKAKYKNLRHAAFSLRKAAVASIKKSAEPAPPGQPVATRGQRGANVRASIFTNVVGDSAIIGPRESYVGDVMHAHEFGKRRGDQEYEARPTMFPALVGSTERFADDWKGSIGE